MNISTEKRFIKTFPCLQNALDIFKNRWACKIPCSCSSDVLVSGKVDAFIEDSRPTEAVSVLGNDDRNFDRFKILELGPLEAGHTYQLEKLGGDVLAIESNAEAFMKCLIVKETLGLKSRFLLGDSIQFLEKSIACYDLIFASGILYHLEDPIRALELISRRCHSVYIWTHVVGDENSKFQENLKAEPYLYQGMETVLYRWRYQDTNKSHFWGGIEQSACWMKTESILFWLEQFGFQDVQIVQQDNDHVHAPCVSICAKKTDKTQIKPLS